MDDEFDRLNRLPDRRVFSIDAGNRSIKDSEEYVKKLMIEYRARKTNPPNEAE